VFLSTSAHMTFHRHMRQREDEVEIRDRQNARCVDVQPVATVDPLAGRTMLRGAPGQEQPGVREMAELALGLYALLQARAELLRGYSEDVEAPTRVMRPGALSDWTAQSAK